MKYLKYFEAAGWTDFISRLSNEQFKRRVANKIFIDLSQKEQSAIINMLKPKIYSDDVSLNFNIRMTKDGQKMSRVSYHNYDMMIYKEEKDDWYYVLSGRDLFNPNLIPSFHPFYLSPNKLVTKRLECDQFDGLLRMISEFLEFIQNKKNENFEVQPESMYRSLTDDESKYYLNWKKEKITQPEFERLKSMQEKYYKSDEHTIKYDENRTHYTFIKYDNQFKTVTLPIEVTKIGDDWWIVTYVPNKGAFPDDCNYLCDTIDGVEEWFRENL